MLGSQLNLDKYVSIESVPMLMNIHRLDFQFSVVASIAASLPVLLDLIIDSLNECTRELYIAKLAVWLLLLSSLIPNLIIFIYVIPTHHFEVLPSINGVRLITSLIGANLVLNSYGSSVWKLKYIYILLLPISIMVISLSFLPFQDYDTQAKIEVVSTICQFIILAIFLFSVFSWIKNIISASKKSKELSADNFYGSLNLISSFSVAVATIIGESIYGSTMSIDTDVNILIWHTYMFTTFSVIVAALNDRVIRSKTTLANVSE
eukprot:gene14174-30174_t